MSEQRLLSPVDYNVIVNRHKQDLVDLLNRAAMDGVSFEVAAAGPLENPPAKTAEDGTVHDHTRFCNVYPVPLIMGQPLGLLTRSVTVNIVLARALKPTGKKSYIVEQQEIVVGPCQPAIKISAAASDIDFQDCFPGAGNSIDWRQK